LPFQSERELADSVQVFDLDPVAGSFEDQLNRIEAMLIRLVPSPGAGAADSTLVTHANHPARISTATVVDSELPYKHE
jgi:hypothetical protein